MAKDHIFITTFNKRLYDNYAKELIKTYTNTQQHIPLYVFVEDDIKQYDKVKNVTYFNLIELEPQLKNFIDRNKKRPVVDFFQDAIRFSYKVFAQSASRNYGKKIYYVDSDSVFMKQIPWEWFDKCLPDGTFLSFYDRPLQYTETGFLAFNSTNSICDNFFEMYTNYYKYDTVYNIHRAGANGKQKPFWTDCHTLDGTRNAFKNNKDYVEKKLGDGKNAHIMARDIFINPYIDHKKGKRKTQPNSPEWLIAKGKS